MIDGRTVLAGVMGCPVSHSRSPLLHNYWCAVHRVNGAYLPLPTEPAHFETAVRGLAAAGFRGVNVTIPHKEAALTLCDALTPVARRAGAVNTLSFEAGSIHGDCTDGTGFCDNLRAHGVASGGRALILGAGGAARAIAAALLDEGSRVTLTNRTAGRARDLAEILGGADFLPWEDWPSRLAEYTLLVNATSLGLNGSPSLAWEAALSHADPALCVADIVYTPRQTALLRAAQVRGLKTVDGLGMLIHQARKGFQSWFGVMPDIDEAVVALLADTVEG